MIQVSGVFVFIPNGIEYKCGMQLQLAMFSTDQTYVLEVFMVWSEIGKMLILFEQTYKGYGRNRQGCIQ